MINLSKKLYISILSVLLLLIVAGTATFAWFELNTNAWFEGMELQVTSGNGVLVSVNGVSWRNNLNQTDIKKAVVAKSKGYTLNSNLDYISPNGTVISSDGYEADFSRIGYSDVTSLDGVKFNTRDGVEVPLSQLEYVSLDLFFKTDDDTSTTVFFSGYERVLTTGERIPKTNIYTADQESITFPTHLNNKFSTYTKEGLSVEYDNAFSYLEQGETIKNFKTYAHDAFRFSTVVEQKDDEPLVKMFEINEGNGSYATNLDNSKYVEGLDLLGARYDANKNAAFTYLNNVRGYYSSDNSIAPIKYEEKPETYKSFNRIDAAKVLTLDESNDFGNDKTAKVTLTMWIDGWDADCFDAVYSQKIVCDFAFTTAEPQNGTKTITLMSEDQEIENFEIQAGYSIDQVDPVCSNNKKFKYWAINTDLTKPYDFSQIIKADTTLVAVWE